MVDLLHETLFDSASRAPDRAALSHGQSDNIDFQGFASAVDALAAQFIDLGIQPNDRIAIYLPKEPLTAFAFYAAGRAGAVFVPVNPVLKAPQVAHILADCNVRLLVTSRDRLAALTPVLADCPDLKIVMLQDESEAPAGVDVVVPELRSTPKRDNWPRRIDQDMAAILYTSGSTGRPKGVILSHRNIVAGADSVSRYLEITDQDRLLAVLPFSFDYGLNQLTTSVLRGAHCVLFDYLLPNDVLKAVTRHHITGLAAVPPLWAQLANLEWSDEARASLRYITNSGGAMPTRVLAALRSQLPNTSPYLMYGLTEAFRSTYLPPALIDERPGSMGKAIPNAEIMVVDADGNPVAAGETGELVHRGALVALGYWNDTERTAERFKPAPGQPQGIPVPEMAVWSGDSVRRDEDGFLYFVGRTDGMLKTSGYRVSPEEIEEIAYASGQISAAAAIGVADDALGQAIVLVVAPITGSTIDENGLMAAFRDALPRYMHPREIVVRESLPQNPNGKINRKALGEELATTAS